MGQWPGELLLLLLSILWLQSLLRTLRETAALREGMLRVGCAIHCRFCAQGVPKMSSEKLFCGWGRRSIASSLARQVPRKRSENHAKSIPNLARNHRKTCPEAASKTEKHQWGTRVDFLSIFLQFWACAGLWFGPILRPKSSFFVVQKIIKKQVPLKTWILEVFVAFQGVARSIFIDFWS